MSATTTAAKSTARSTNVPSVPSFDTRPQALALWAYVGAKLGYDLTPGGIPDFMVIRDALKEAGGNDSLRAICDLALENWQGVVRRYLSRLTPDDLGAVQAILCSTNEQPEPLPASDPQPSHDDISTSEAEEADESLQLRGPTAVLRPGDSIAVELIDDQPFPHRLWRVAAINPESGLITTRSSHRLAPDDGEVRIRKYGTDGVEAPGARPMRWHAPPSKEHIAKNEAEKSFFDAWVGLRSVGTELTRVWEEDSQALFNSTVSTLIELELLADSDEQVEPEEWEDVKVAINQLSLRLEDFDDDALARAIKIADKLRLAGLNVRSKRQSMADAYPQETS